MTETFGSGIGALHDAFSVHSKGATYKIKSADEAHLSVSVKLRLIMTMKEFINDERVHQRNNRPGSLP